MPTKRMNSYWDNKPTNMIICGYTDYEAEASALLDDMERFKEEKRHGKNDTAGKAVQSQPA